MELRSQQIISCHIVSITYSIAIACADIPSLKGHWSAALAIQAQFIERHFTKSCLAAQVFSFRHFSEDMCRHTWIHARPLG